MSVETKEKEELEEALAEVRNKKRKRKAIIAVVLAAVVLLTLVMMWLYGYNYSKNQAQNEINALKEQIDAIVNTPVVVDPVTPEIVLGVVTAKTAEISELATAEYLFTNAAKFTSSADSWLPSWLTEKSFIQKWDGVVKAGIDLTALAVTVDDMVITVTMPKAQILSYEVDYNSVQVLDEKNNVFNPITVEDKNKFDMETADEMKNRAIRNGLLEKAQKNTENILAGLMQSSIENIEDYTFQFIVVE